MDIKSILNKEAKEKKESFWALIVDSDRVSAAVWEIVDSKVNVIVLSPSIEWNNDEELVSSTDKALSDCFERLPKEYDEPEKTVFGVLSSWIEGGNIKSEYLGKLKKVCDELSLVPSGFVVLSEAIAHYMKVEHGTPLSALIVGLGERSIEMSLFKQGNLAGSFNIVKSNSLKDDITEGLARFDKESRSFTKVYIFGEDNSLMEDLKNIFVDFDWASIDSNFLHPPQVDIISSDEKIQSVVLAGGTEIAGAMGVQKENVEDDIKTDSKAEDLGFVVNRNLEEIPKRTLNVPSINLPPMKMPEFKLDRKPLIFGIITLFIFIFGGFCYWWFVPTAKVIIYLSPKKIDEMVVVSIDEDFSPRELKVDVSSEKTASTTGTKTVGEKAKGSVKVQNGTAGAVKLNAGTELVSSTGLVFEIFEQASVSAALSPSSPGTAVVEVIASDIGPEFNLVKDEIFKVGNYPKADVDAVSTDNFSGGSSRQISAVSEDDANSLETELKEELLLKAKNQFISEITENEVLIEGSISSEEVEKKFSNKVGDEASTIKLNLGLNVSAKFVSKEKLSKKAAESLSDKVPEGFVLRDDQLSYKFDKSGKEDDEYDVLMTANLLPKIDEKQIAKDIVGKYPTAAKEYLSRLAGFVNAEFKIKPFLPGRLGTLPHVTDKITIEFSSEK